MLSYGEVGIKSDHFNYKSFNEIKSVLKIFDEKSTVAGDNK